MTKLFSLVFMTWGLVTKRIWLKVCCQSSLFIWYIFFHVWNQVKIHFQQKKKCFFMFETEWNSFVFFFFVLSLTIIFFFCPNYFFHLVNENICCSFWKKKQKKTLLIFTTNLRNWEWLSRKKFFTSCQVIQTQESKLFWSKRSQAKTPRQNPHWPGK